MATGHQIPPKHLDRAAVLQLPVPSKEMRGKQMFLLPLRILTDLAGHGWGECAPRLDLGTGSFFLSFLCWDFPTSSWHFFFFHAHGNICLRSKRHRIPLSQVSFGWRKRPDGFSSPPSCMHLFPELCHLASVHLYSDPFLTWYSWVNIPVIPWQEQMTFRTYTDLVKSVSSNSASSFFEGNEKMQFGISLHENAAHCQSAGVWVWWSSEEKGLVGHFGSY